MTVDTTFWNQINSILTRVPVKSLGFPHLDQGYRAAVDPQYAVSLHCDRCNVSWQGCDDERQCEFCGRDCLGDMDHPDNPEGLSSRSHSL